MMIQLSLAVADVLTAVDVSGFPAWPESLLLLPSVLLLTSLLLLMCPTVLTSVLLLLSLLLWACLMFLVILLLSAVPARAGNSAVAVEPVFSAVLKNHNM
jgi:hypothetical protein